jgi:hypothetical protein
MKTFIALGLGFCYGNMFQIILRDGWKNDIGGLVLCAISFFIGIAFLIFLKKVGTV